MKKTALLFTVAALASLAGCSKSDNYTPPVNATGEDIFYANCTKCHKPGDSGVMTLTAAKSKEAIIEKVQNGSARMPAFPNIKGEPAQRLADFILANSTTP